MTEAISEIGPAEPLAGWSDAPLKVTLPPDDDLAATLGELDEGVTRRPSLVASLSAATPNPVDRYEIQDVLGKGAMGVVHRASDRDLARQVALKRLRSKSSSPAQVSRFLREAQVTGQLEHPGIVPVHDVGVDEEGRFFYVMRLVRGQETLQSVIHRLRARDPETHRQYSFERRVLVVRQVAQILGYAHARGVIHRDVKPENIMLGPFGEVCLVDWGVAKLIASSDEPETEQLSQCEGLAPTETAAGRIVGTPQYMAPEQANGGKVSPATDLYSLTAVLYELLTLKKYAGDAKTFPEIMEKILGGSHIPAEDHFDRVNGRVPRALSYICDKGLAKDPAKRFESARHLEGALEGWLEGDTPVVCPATFLISVLNKWKKAIDRNPVPVTFATFLIPVGAVFWHTVHRIYLALGG